MSYEGYKQFWCKKGHYWEVDCYSYDHEEKCPWCGKDVFFENSVDVTNGSHDEDGNRIDGLIDPVVKKEVSGICSTCGGKHICEVIYVIPRRRKK